MREPMGKPTLIISDLHLGAVPESVSRQFIRFTQEWRGLADLMLVNGDLFDFWFEYRSVMPAQHFQVLRALAELRDSGVRLLLVGGNHDAWGGRFLEEEVGIELTDGPIEMVLGGRRAFIAHGDGLGPGDHGYKILRRTIRSWPARTALRWIHPDVVHWLVRHISRTQDASGRESARSSGRAAILESYAMELLERRHDLELVIFGHCHTPTLKSVADRRCYINTGDWVQHRTFTVVTEEAIEQKEYEVAKSS